MRTTGMPFVGAIDARNSPTWFFKRRPSDAQGFRAVLNFFLRICCLSCRFFSCPQFLEKKTNRRRRHSGQFICAHSWSSVLLTGVLGIVFETKLSPMPFHVPDLPWSILWKYYLMPPLEEYNALAFFGYYLSYRVSCYKGIPEQYPQQANPPEKIVHSSNLYRASSGTEATQGCWKHKTNSRFGREFNVNEQTVGHFRLKFGKQ